MNPLSPGHRHPKGKTRSGVGRNQGTQRGSLVEHVRISSRSKTQAFHKRAKRRETVGVIDFKKALRCGLLNTDGLGAGTFEDVKATIRRKQPDLCVLLETKRRLEDVGSDISIDGYALTEIQRSDVAGDRGGGGIAFYTRQGDGLVFHRHTPDIDDENLSFVNNERFWVTLKSQSHKTALCGMYIGCQYQDDRHGQWNDSIYRVVEREAAALRASGHRVIYLGDMNGHVGCLLGQGVVGNHRGINPNGLRFLNFLRNTDSVHINGACRTPGQWDTRYTNGLWTRQRGGVSSIIDYAGISKEHLHSVISLDIDDQGEYGTESDHNWMFLDVADKFVKKTRVSRAPIRKPTWDISDDQDWTAYQENILRRIDIVDTNDLDTLNNLICDSLLGALTDEIGVKTPSIRKRNTRLPRDLVDEIAFKRQLEANWKSRQTALSNRPAGLDLQAERDGVMVAEKLFLDQSSKVSELLFLHRKIKRPSILKACAGNSVSARRNFWSYLKPNEKQSTDISAVLSPSSGVLKCNVDEIKSEVEQHLLSTFQGSFEPPLLPPAHNLPDDHSYAAAPPEGAVSDHSYSIHPRPVLVNLDNSGSLAKNPSAWLNKEFNTPEVGKVVKKLKNCKAKGWDRIPNEAIKNAPLALLHLITRLFNLVKKHGRIPQGWNRGRITLIHKSDLREQLSNYRPITVIISLSGLYSKVLNERLIQVVEAHGLLGEVQNGFRKERGGADNSFILDTLLWKSKASRVKLHLGYIDISKGGYQD